MNSETSQIRDTVKKYCVGKGVDIGFGGDPVVEDAITIDLPTPYTKVGNHTAQIQCDARSLNMIDNNSLSYVYSSHLIEDFVDTKNVLSEWYRTIKVGGYMIIYAPVEKVYRDYCKKNNHPYNQAHKVDAMNADYILNILYQIDSSLKIIKKIDLINVYSFLLIVQKGDRYMDFAKYNVDSSDRVDYYSVLPVEHLKIINDILSDLKSEKKGKVTSIEIGVYAGGISGFVNDQYEKFSHIGFDLFNLSNVTDFNKLSKTLKNVTLVKGDVQDTLIPTIEKEKIKKVDFAFIDVDFFNPIKHSFEVLSEIISEGGYLAIHDYKSNTPDVTKFVDDVLSKDTRFSLEIDNKVFPNMRIYKKLSQKTENKIDNESYDYDDLED